MIRFSSVLLWASVAVAVSVAPSLQAAAQQAAGQQAASEALPNQAQNQGEQQTPGQPYLVAEHQDWQIICARLDDGSGEYCEMYQLLREPNGQPVAEISIAALAETGDIVAGATITTPLETFLPAGLGFRLSAESEQMRIEPFRVCTVVGCIVRMGLTAEEVRALERGSDAFITIVPFVAPDQPVDVAVSLRGFTAAMRDLRARTPNPPEALTPPCPHKARPRQASNALCSGFYFCLERGLCRRRLWCKRGKACATNRPRRACSKFAANKTARSHSE